MLLFMMILVWASSNNAQAETYDKTLALNNVWSDGEFKNNDDVFMYKVVLPSAGTLSIEGQSISSYSTNFYLSDKDLTKQYWSTYTYGASVSSPQTVNGSRILEAGTYYIKLQARGDKIGTFRIRGTFTPMNNNEREPNNVFAQAQAISPNQVVTGLISEDDNIDFYMFTISKKQRVKVEIAVYTWECYSIWDKDYKMIGYGNRDGEEAAPGHIEYSEVLEAGAYYIKVGEGHTGKYTVQYSLITPVTNIQLPSTKKMTVGTKASLKATIVPSDATDKGVTWQTSNSNIVSVDENGRLTAKVPGRATITAVANDDNTLKATCTVTVSPKKASISKVKNISKRKMRITWKKQKGISGYQIQYSTSKMFKKPKSKKISYYYSNTYTVSSLKKKKTYYVRVRTYADDSSGTIYGAWSDVKKIKIKK